MNTTHIHALGLVKETSFKGHSTKGVLRLADVDGKDRLSKFSKRRDGQFDDRDFFFLNESRNQQIPLGTWAFWHMEVVPNDRFPSRDYVLKVERDSEKPPIALCSSGCRNFDALLKYLDTPSFFNLVEEVIVKSGCSILLTVYEEQKNRGVLIKAEDIENGRISEQTMTLQIYTLDKLPLRFSDVMPNKVSGFWPTASMGMPDSRLPLVSLKSAILQAVKERTASWTAFKAACPGATHSDNNVYRTFIEALKSERTANAVNTYFHPSPEEYDQALQSLIEEGKLFFENKDELSTIAARILSSDESLVQSVKDEMAKRWELDNRDAIDSARAEEQKAKEALASVDAELKKTQTSLDAEKRKLRELHHEKDALIEELSLQLEGIKTETAKTLSQYPLWSLLSGSSVARPLETQSQAIDFEKAIKNENATDVTEIAALVATLEENLMVAGVKEEPAEGLAAVLLAAYVKKTPLLLAGPAAKSLADALSLVVFGTDARRVDGAVESLVDSPEDAINFVTDAVKDNRIEHLLAEAVRKQLFVIFDLPFAEELVLMSPGILHYAQVICTELFVTNEPEGCMTALSPTEAVIRKLGNVSREAARRRLVFAKSMTVTPLIKNRLSSWLGIANVLSAEAVSDDTEARLLLLPQALLTGNFSALDDLVSDEESKLPSTARTLLAGSLALYGRNQS